MALQNQILNPPVTSTSGLRKEWTIGLADLIALGAFVTGDVILMDLPAGAVVTYARIKHTEAVTGTGPFAVVTARITTANNNYGSGTLDVFAAPSNTAGTGLITDVTGAAENFAAVTPIYVHFVVTTYNLSAALTGEIKVWLDYIILK